MHRLAKPDKDALRAALNAAMHRSADARFIHRLHAVLLVGAGHGCYDIAAWLGDDARSIERWVRLFATGGAAGLHDAPRPGRPARLTGAQAERLADELRAGPLAFGHAQARWSGKLLARHLRANFDVAFSVRSCQRLLRRHSVDAAADGTAGGAAV